MEKTNRLSLCQLAGIVARAMGIERPKQAQQPDETLCGLVEDLCKEPIERTLIYNPDAVGQCLAEKYPQLFASVRRETQLTLPFRAVMPSYTPVCFGTMYTGALPEVHGIREYAKPVISIDSLFDSALRAGKKVAIVAVEGSSMAHIYNDRALDYYIMPYDEQVRDQALKLIEEDRYDLISVYTQEYDDVMHRTGVESPESMMALQHQIDIFEALTAKIHHCWKNHTVLYTFSPDHGIHQQEDGHGNHGTDHPLDLNILHYIGVQNAAVKK